MFFCDGKDLSLEDRIVPLRLLGFRRLYMAVNIFSIKDFYALYSTQVRPFFDPNPLDREMNNYEALAIGLILEKERIGVSNLRNKLCRFCGLSEPETTFNSIPHSVPEFLGNTKLISSDECDSCNNKFGTTIEDDLANFLGLSRILTRMEGKKGLPKEVFGRGRVQYGKNTKMIEVVNDVDSDFITHDPERKEVTFRKPRLPYVPAGVYKCLNKIALSIMPEEYLNEFKGTIEWVLSCHESHTFLPPSALCAIQTTIALPNPYPEIHLMLLKRKDAVFGRPYMIFQISVRNFVFQIPLYRGMSDLPLIGERNPIMSIPIMPNRYSLNEYTRPFVSHKILELGNNSRVKGDVQEFTMRYDRLIPLDHSKMIIDSKGYADFLKNEDV